jgi:uncharacterized protein YoxC
MSEQITSDNKVQLGCGTLIIIALIVMIFSGGKDVDKLQRQLDDMSRQLDRMEKKVDALSKQLPSSQPLERR